MDKDRYTYSEKAGKLRPPPRSCLKKKGQIRAWRMITFVIVTNCHNCFIVQWWMDFFYLTDLPTICDCVLLSLA